MTTARIKPFRKKHNNNIGCFDSSRINPRNITEKRIALYFHNIHFCSIWKSQNVSFNKAIQELKSNFKNVDKNTFDKHVENFFQYEYNPKKAQSQTTNMIVYDMETYNTDRVVPYSNNSILYLFLICKLSKLPGKHSRDITQRENEKCGKDCIVFKGTICIKDMLDQTLKIKGEGKKIRQSC